MKEESAPHIHKFKYFRVDGARGYVCADEVSELRMRRPSFGVDLAQKPFGLHVLRPAIPNLQMLGSGFGGLSLSLLEEKANHGEHCRENI